MRSYELASFSIISERMHLYTKMEERDEAFSDEEEYSDCSVDVEQCPAPTGQDRSTETPVIVISQPEELPEAETPLTEISDQKWIPAMEQDMPTTTTTRRLGSGHNSEVCPDNRFLAPYSLQSQRTGLSALDGGLIPQAQARNFESGPSGGKEREERVESNTRSTVEVPIQDDVMAQQHDLRNWIGSSLRYPSSSPHQPSPFDDYVKSSRLSFLKQIAFDELHLKSYSHAAGRILEVIQELDLQLALGTRTDRLENLKWRELLLETELKGGNWTAARGIFDDLLQAPAGVYDSTKIICFKLLRAVAEFQYNLDEGDYCESLEAKLRCDEILQLSYDREDMRPLLLVCYNFLVYVYKTASVYEEADFWDQMVTRASEFPSKAEKLQHAPVRPEALGHLDATLTREEWEKLDLTWTITGLNWVDFTVAFVNQYLEGRPQTTCNPPNETGVTAINIDGPGETASTVASSSRMSRSDLETLCGVYGIIILVLLMVIVLK